MEVIEEKGSVEDYTQDGTVDLQGRPVLRSRTGRWKACSFLVGKKKSFTILYKYFVSYPEHECRDNVHITSQFNRVEPSSIQIFKMVSESSPRSVESPAIKFSLSDHSPFIFTYQAQYQM
jgi:hypothetical protein